MRDKYLGRDGIEEKYNFRGDIINYFKNIGTIGGGVFVLLSLGKDVGEVLTGGGVTTFSYFVGDSLHKLNNKIKEKALKNLESRTAA